MRQEDEFCIKGAAHKPDEAEQPPAEVQEGPQNSAEKITEKAAEADQAQGKDGPSQEGEDGQEDDGEEDEDEDATNEYKWVKCEAPVEQYGAGHHYFIHEDTHETTWEAPNEPYWLWDATTQQKHSLQFPDQETRSRAEVVNLDQSNPPAENYTGYNPKIHGNYDPNADYAQYHNRKRVEEAAAADPFAAAQQVGADAYQTTMALNRFTGNAQASHLGADRHSDTAKSSRQMNSFFDVDAAANAHDGRSLKQERREHKVTKKQAQQYNKQKKEKKLEKRKKFLLS